MRLRGRAFEERHETISCSNRAFRASRVRARRVRGWRAARRANLPRGWAAALGG